MDRLVAYIQLHHSRGARLGTYHINDNHILCYHLSKGRDSYLVGEYGSV